MSRPRGVAAFDFDGTLTPRDTLLPFLARCYGRRRLLQAAAKVGPPWRVEAEVHRRDHAKALLLRLLTAGDDPERVAALGRDYAVELEGILVPEMRERVEAHRRAGHELVAVSASLVSYLRPLLGDRLSFDEVIAVELEVGETGRLTGEMVRPNVRGPEKAVRLGEWLEATGGVDDLELWAYGNSSGDAELLAMADHAVLLQGRRSTMLAPLP